MNIAGLSMEKKTVTLVLTAAMALGGMVSFMDLGKLEDPDFTIFTAIVSTPYSGASPREVEEEVTDRIETAIQTMGQVDEVRSISRAGLSLIVVDLQTTVDQEEIPQAWDELRRKVGDIQTALPPGAGPSHVNDDWGDVYGIFFAITGEGFEVSEIETYAKDLRRELLLVDGVAAVELWGMQREAVYVEISRARLAELGLGPEALVGTLQTQGVVVPDGRIQLDSQWVRIAPTGAFSSVEEMGELLLRGRGSDSMVRLKDVATLRRGVWDPPQDLLLFNGEQAIGLGIATVEGGNVVDTGRAVQQRLGELENARPVGMNLNVIAYQSRTVTEAVSGFLVNLLSAVAIVIGVLMLFMGWRVGILIGIVLILDILGTFVFMDAMDIALQRISLGALIIALGMLVDNAIVVAEGMLVRLQRGEAGRQAAEQSVAETRWPLLGATVVAILAFAAISVSEDASGEFLASLFQVVAASLLLSWVLAVTITPVLGLMILKVPDQPLADPYDKGFFRRYKMLLNGAIRHRGLTLVAMTLLLVFSVLGFGLVKRSFFPDSERPQFIVDYWRPEGTHISEVTRDLQSISDWLLQEEEVESVTSFVGSGGLRFILTYEPELPNSSYGQLLITVDRAEVIDELQTRTAAYLRMAFPDAEPRTKRFVFGPATGAKIEARFKGEDPAVLRHLAEQAKAVMRSDAVAKDIRDDWRQRVPVIRPKYAEPQARQAGVTRVDLARSLELASSGTVAGVYREGDDLLPIVFQLPQAERSDVSGVTNAQVWSSATGRTVPVNQVVSGFDTGFEDPLIRRFNRKRTISVQCDPAHGVADTLFQRLRPQIEALPRPSGYELEWGGEYESSTEATSMLMASVPLFFSLMVLIVVALFNNLRQPLIVFLTLPLASIGVTSGLLLTGQPFGFVALLGYLSLAGMLIKNAVVLLDQININQTAGMEPLAALLDAGVSRVRPVCMAAFTTVFGMVPLLADVFWSAMAVTIMAGLTFATVLTLVVVPVLYATLYPVFREPDRQTRDPKAEASQRGNAS